MGSSLSKQTIPIDEFKLLKEFALTIILHSAVQAF